jgi:hypothetical protein
MRLTRFLFFLAGIFLFNSACVAGEIPRTQPAATPTELATELPQISPRIPAPTQTPPPLVFPSTPETVLFPDWVTTFSDPILVSLVGSRPDFQDEFSPLNRGWFYDIAGSPIGPFYAHINDGALVLKLPEGSEKKDSMVFNPTLNRRNFVLSFDFRFWESQPDDYVRFQFSPTKDQAFALDLSKDKNWNFRWGFQNDWKFLTGVYDQFPPEKISVLFMVRDNQCAVYLNHTPLDYSSSCMSDPRAGRSWRAVSFHLISAAGHTARVTIDNVKLWDLDKIPDLP